MVIIYKKLLIFLMYIYRKVDIIYSVICIGGFKMKFLTEDMADKMSTIVLDENSFNGIEHIFNDMVGYSYDESIILNLLKNLDSDKNKFKNVIIKYDCNDLCYYNHMYIENHTISMVQYVFYKLSRLFIPVVNGYVDLLSHGDSNICIEDLIDFSCVEESVNEEDKVVYFITMCLIFSTTAFQLNSDKIFGNPYKYIPSKIKNVF